MNTYSQKNNFSLKLFAGLALFLLSVGQVSAAVIFVNPAASAAVAGHEFTASVFLDTEMQAINALEGTITYPRDLVTVSKIDNGSSVINFWLKPPAVDTPGTISFSGVTAGGYNGKEGFVFAITFRTKALGSGTVSPVDISAMLDDGKGTPSAVAVALSNISVVPTEADVAAAISTPIIPIPVSANMRDTTAPESFTAAVSASPDLFEGRFFLSFAAQDKGVGIDRYEVCEGALPYRCTPATSPYELKDQKLDAPILVKAYDKSGNEKDSIVSAQKPFGVYERLFAILILIISVIALGAYFLRGAIRGRVQKIS